MPVLTWQAPNLKPEHTTTLGVLRAVIKTDGLQGLWRGAVPGMVRIDYVMRACCFCLLFVGTESCEQGSTKHLLLLLCLQL